MQTGRIKVIILICTVSFFVACDSPPSDEELIQRFYKNQEDFNKIIKMLERDSNIRAVKMRRVEYKDNSEPKISNEKLKEYHDILARLGIKSGVYRGHDGGIYFNVYAQPGILSGSGKYYVFSAKKYELVESLDVLENNPDFEGIRYRKLKENWYLTYSKWH